MALVRALIFGSIGTITETSEWQRHAFNAAFGEHGLDWHWSAPDYRAMISGDRGSVGGSNRIADYARLKGEAIDDATAAAVHQTKTLLFQRRMTQQKLPLNPGVDDLLTEAERHGLLTVFASTTARDSVEAMVGGTVPSLEGRFDLVVSGDDVGRIKPDPEIYEVVLARLGLEPTEVIAIEDSQPSLDAARGAGIATFAVPGALWRGHAFDGAVRVFETLRGVDLATLTAPLESAVGAG